MKPDYAYEKNYVPKSYDSFSKTYLSNDLIMSKFFSPKKFLVFKTDMSSILLNLKNSKTKKSIMQNTKIIKKSFA